MQKHIPIFLNNPQNFNFYNFFVDASPSSPTPAASPLLGTPKMGVPGQLPPRHPSARSRRMMSPQPRHFRGSIPSPRGASSPTASLAPFWQNA